jgi:hypothetical protein
MHPAHRELARLLDSAPSSVEAFNLARAARVRELRALIASLPDPPLEVDGMRAFDQAMSAQLRAEKGIR